MIYKLIGGFVIGCLIGIGVYEVIKWISCSYSHNQKHLKNKKGK